jgi:hypothetical protein
MKLMNKHMIILIFLRRCWCSGKDSINFNKIKHQQPTLRLFQAYLKNALRNVLSSVVGV